MLIENNQIFKDIYNDIEDKIAALFDPLGNAFHTALSFGVVGEDVLITGAGPIGIMAAKICQSIGARKVILTDVVSIDEGNKVVDRLERKYNTHSEWITDRVNFEWMDVTNEDSIQNVIDKYNKINILINNNQKNMKYTISKII